MFEQLLGVMGFGRKSKEQVPPPLTPNPEKIVLSPWQEKEKRNLETKSANYNLKDTFIKGLPSETPSTNETVSNKGMAKSMFTLRAEKGNLPGNTIDSADIREEIKIKKEEAVKLEQEKHVNAAAAASNAPSPNSHDVETRTQLPHP
jgi:hypothetical protein